MFTRDDQYGVTIASALETLVGMGYELADSWYDALMGIVDETDDPVVADFTRADRVAIETEFGHDLATEKDREAAIRRLAAAINRSLNRWRTALLNRGSIKEDGSATVYRNLCFDLNGDEIEKYSTQGRDAFFAGVLMPLVELDGVGKSWTFDEKYVRCPMHGNQTEFIVRLVAGAAAGNVEWAESFANFLYYPDELEATLTGKIMLQGFQFEGTFYPYSRTIST